MVYYTEITDKIFIGELNASKEPNDFDIIVNLAYINEYFNRGLKHRESRIINYNKNKIVYEFGLYDSDSDADYFSYIIEVFIDYFIFLTNNERKKILFHCQSGKSRSVSMALAYLCKTENISVDEGLSLIKQKRHVANPRKIFVDCVRNFINI